MPRAATLSEAVGMFLTDSVTLVRLVAGSFTSLAAQDARLNTSRSGRLAEIGEGLTGRADAVPMYMEPDADVEVGDTFHQGDSKYQVLYVAPAAKLATEAAASYLTAWCVVDRPHGGSGS